MPLDPNHPPPPVCINHCFNKPPTSRSMDVADTGPAVEGPSAARSRSWCGGCCRRQGGWKPRSSSSPRRVQLESRSLRAHSLCWARLRDECNSSRARTPRHRRPSACAVDGMAGGDFCGGPVVSACAVDGRACGDSCGGPVVDGPAPVWSTAGRVGFDGHLSFAGWVGVVWL